MTGFVVLGHIYFNILKRFTDTLCIKHPNPSMKCAKILYYFTSTSLCTSNILKIKVFLPWYVGSKNLNQNRFILISKMAKSRKK